MRRVLALVLAMAMVLSSGITGAFAAVTPIYNDSGVADSGGIVDVTITSTKTDMVVGETQTLDVTVRVTQDSGEIPVAWASSNDAYATVNPTTGEVTAVSAGTTTITATVGTRSNTIAITVEAAKSDKAAITSFKIGNAVGNITENAKTIAVEVPVGTAVTALAPVVEVSAKATVSPASEATANFTNPVTYTVTAEDGNTTNAYLVTVTVATAPVTKYNVTVTGGTANPTTAAKDETVTITAGAPVAGQVFDKWTTADGVTFTDDTTATTTFTMLDKAVTVVATYKEKPVDPTPPTITSVTVTPSVETIKVGAKLQLTAVVDSGSPTVQDVEWSSSSDATATVDANGLVTAKVAGSVAIKATAKGTNVEGIANITIEAADPEPVTKYNVTVTGGTANPTTAAVGETVTITAGAPVAGQVFDKWTSTDSVKFASATTATTTFTMLDKAVTVVATYKEEPVTPPVNPPTIKSVAVSPKTANVKVEVKTQLTATVVLDSGSTAKETVEWTSSAPTIATVDTNGLVTAVAKGTATITATSTADNSKSDTATITVEDKAAPTLSSIEITTPANKLVYTVGDALDITGLVVTGTYSDNSEKVVPITAANIAGFNSTTPATSQTLTIAVGDITIDYIVEIKAKPVTPPTKHTVTVTGGTTDKATAAKDETVTITAGAPATGKVFDKWTSTDSVKFANTTTATTTFTMLDKAVTVVATYKEKPVDPTPDKKALTEAIKTATELKATITANTNGNDVLTTNKWALKSDLDAFGVAITTAQAVVNKTDATAQNVTDAVAALAAATTAFDKKCTAGLNKDLPHTDAKKDLRKLIDTTDKEFLKVYESTNGANIAPNEKWATNAQRKALIEVIEKAKAVNNNKNATQTAIDEISKGLTTAWELFKTQIKSGTKGSSSSSGSGGGSSSGGGTSTPPPSVDAPSSNVGGSGEVKSDDIKAETSKAVADAVKAAPGATANVTVKNADNITPAALKEMAAAATKAGGKAQLMADTVVNGVVETRLYINPALAGALKDSIKLGVSTNSLEIDATKAKFASFDNNIAVASFAQQGSFGMKIQAAVKLDLTTLNTKTLVFYSYDKATNKYIPIVAPAYTIDKNGYLHFSTTVGGDIIITDKALVAKK